MNHTTITKNNEKEKKQKVENPRAHLFSPKPMNKILERPIATKIDLWCSLFKERKKTEQKRVISTRASNREESGGTGHVSMLRCEANGNAHRRGTVHAGITSQKEA